MAIEACPVTAGELERLPQEDAHVELVRGVIVRMAPAGHDHGRTAGRLVRALSVFLAQQPIGELYVADTGFLLGRNPDTVRAPDAAFVTHERVAQQGGRHGFFVGPPDLAVEVVSPDDTHQQVEAKVLDYLQAGTRLVWVVQPATRTVTAYRSTRDVRLLTAADLLDGDDVLPGFAVPVRSLFE